MERIDRKNDLILLNLLEADDWLTSTQLAQKMQVSDRTVRSRLAELSGLLNGEDIELIAERGKGYRIAAADKPALRRVLSRGGVCADAGFRRDLMLELLDLSAPEDIDELCDRLFMSRTALENELKNVKKELSESKSDLVLVRRKNTLLLDGNERSKRVMISYHMDNRFHNPMSYDLMGYSAYFPYDELHGTIEAINDVLRRHNIAVSDTGRLTIAVHSLIAIKRIEKGLALDSKCLSESEREDCSAEYSAAQEIFMRMKERFGVEANRYEYEALAYCIYFRRFFSIGDNSHKSAEENIDAKYLNAVAEILAEIRGIYCMDLTNDRELLINLAYHLQSTVNKRGNGQHYANPILEDVRSKYPFVFELAITFRDYFLQKLGIALDESETAYIAVHLGAAVERLKIQNGTHKLKAVLVCHASLSTSKFLMAKILSLFGNRLFLCGPYSVFDSASIMEEQPDIIISTTKTAMINCGNTPIAYINLIPDARDAKQLGRVIDAVEYNVVSSHCFTDFFDEKFFYPELDVKSPADAINIMADDLARAGIAQENFKESTIQRESFSTTVLKNGIALPHPKSFYSNRTTISVATLARPVEWSGSKAQIVFMMAVKAGEQQFLRDFYEMIVNLSDSEESVNRVLKIRNFDELIAYLNTLN